MRHIGKRVLTARLIALAAVGLAGLASAAVPAAAGPIARRIVSLNLCTDQLLVHLVPRERIAALSWLAGDAKVSTIGERAQGIPLIAGRAEEVLALEPDLVVTTEHAGPATVALLRRLGRRVVTIPLAEDFDAMRAGLRELAAAVGEPERGAREIDAFDARLAAIATRYPPDATHKPTALSWEINRIAAGAGTLVDRIIAAAGLDNLASRERLGRGGVAPLELIVAHPPDVLVLANGPDDYPTAAADNLRHPALAEAMRGRQSVRLPMPLWLCASPRTADAVELLAAARARAEATVAPTH